MRQPDPRNSSGISLSHDFGNVIAHHPVQNYENFTMLTFLVASLVLIGRR